jgi:hypothetical protein
MGYKVGAFREDEVRDLSPGERKELKRHTLQALQNSREIRALMTRNPKLFTNIKKVKEILRKKVNPVRKRMMKK